jgi:stage V sporulation protein T
MKNSGIIRRIDDLGRIVIPKEIRRNLRVKEGTPIEIAVDENGNIILTPYLTKAEKLKKWMDTVLTTMDRDLGEIEFYFHGSAIVCVREDKYQFLSDSVGIAVCSPNDEYNSSIGQCIAYCRAAGMSIPDFIFED